MGEKPAFVELISSNTTVVSPVGDGVSNTTVPSDGLNEFVNFVQNNIWVPIIAGFVVVLFVLFVVVYGIRKYNLRCLGDLFKKTLTELTGDLPVVQNIADNVGVSWTCKEDLNKKLRHKRYEYPAYREGYVAIPERMEMQREQGEGADENTGYLRCQLYLRSKKEYTLTQQLPQLGARVGKYWFLVKDVSTGAQKILTIAPKGHHMSFVPNTSNRNTLIRFFAMLRHPYILPIDEVDFLVEDEPTVIVQPFSSKGSLRDYIRNTKCKSNTQIKEAAMGKPLPVPQIQLFGRHILEALLFIEEYDLPAMMHLHSGNIILQNFNCRISGIENCFLGQTPRNVKLLKSSCEELKDYRYHHCVCFGHVLFEMATGREVGTYPPKPEDWADVTNSGLQEILEFVLTNEDKHPTIHQIIRHDFFHGITTRELVGYSPPMVRVTKQMKTLLKTVKEETNLAVKKQKKNGKNKLRNVSLKSEVRSHVTSYTPKVNEVEENNASTQRGSSPKHSEVTERSGLIEYTYTMTPSHGSTTDSNLL